MPVKVPPYIFLVALKDAHGTETTSGGFSEVSGLPRKLQGLHNNRHHAAIADEVSGVAIHGGGWEVGDDCY